MTTEAHAVPAPVPSPCINVCRMDPRSGLCEGCLRTIDEIAAWSQWPDTAKREVWQAIEARRAVRGAVDAVDAGAGGALPLEPGR